MAKPADLLSVEQAQERILRHFSPLSAEVLALSEWRGRVLAQPVFSPIFVPPFANSSMDGFALRAVDTALASAESPVTLPVTGHIAAGSVSVVDLVPGTSARIMTGAPLPPGADAVIPFENVEERGESIVLRSPVMLGSCVRPAGNDVRPGQPLLEAGSALGAPQIGLLASVGLAEVQVRRRPVVAIFSTGDELVSPGTPLLPGQIYNSNTPMLQAAVEEAGAMPVVLPAVRDDPETIRKALEPARGADLLVTSGGASVGDYDYVKQVLGAQGELDFWRVRVRPGKPLIFGSLGDLPVVGLPGNPTSAMVTFELFVRPAIRTMLGTAPFRPEVDAVLDVDMTNHGGRRTYARVRLRYHGGQFHALPSGGQDSAMLLPLAHADGLLLLPEDREVVPAGESARVLVWRLPADS